ncbi:hypothetical protein B0H17DRAFT_466389 [Mycena rosella]|uniref:Uncharacterized protein n=1 Tax=Mycena rosella TaxID=1033263 RepID=A0AAD7GK05_MYCRO|nr:hypothetical protein B0H17DRAFT_466389 [Mycena rosella]
MNHHTRRRRGRLQLPHPSRPRRQSYVSRQFPTPPAPDRQRCRSSSFHGEPSYVPHSPTWRARAATVRAWRQEVGAICIYLDHPGSGIHVARTHARAKYSAPPRIRAHVMSAPMSASARANRAVDAKMVPARPAHAPRAPRHTYPTRQSPASAEVAPSVEAAPSIEAARSLHATWPARLPCLPPSHPRTRAHATPTRQSPELARSRSSKQISAAG